MGNAGERAHFLSCYANGIPKARCIPSQSGPPRYGQDTSFVSFADPSEFSPDLHHPIIIYKPTYFQRVLRLL